MEAIKNKLKGMGLTDSTIRTYTYILESFFDHFGKVNNFTSQEISGYLDYLMISKNYSARSRNLDMKIIRFYCREFLNFVPELIKAKEKLEEDIKSLDKHIDLLRSYKAILFLSGDQLLTHA